MTWRKDYKEAKNFIPSSNDLLNEMIRTSDDPAKGRCKRKPIFQTPPLSRLLLSPIFGTNRNQKTKGRDWWGPIRIG